MSCCCCEGIIRKKEERLVREEEQEAAGGAAAEGEESRRNMDISLLREQYRCTRETQRRHTQVLLLRTVSQELSEAVSVIPVNQGLTSPPAVTFDPDLTTFDPWHVHLDLRRRCCPAATARSSSSSEAGSSRQEVDSSSDSPSSSRETSPFSGTREEARRSRGRAETRTVQLPVCSRGATAAPQPPASSDESSAPITGSPRSSAPVSTSRLHDAQKEDRSAGMKTPQTPSAPSLRFTRQLSLGGVGSSHQPFPHRKPPRISEAARRLGMYSSF